MVHAKGSTFTARRLWVEQCHGARGLQRLRTEVSPVTAEILDGPVLQGAWYPFDAFIDLNEAIDRTFGTGDLALIDEVARFAADANLRTIYKVFYKVGTVKWILERAARLWRVNYDSGELLTNARPGNDVDLEICDFATPHRVHCLAVLGWARRSVELSGGKDVVGTMRSCRAAGDDRCVLNITWR